MSKIRILHVLTSTAGGLGQSVLTLLKQLDAHQYELTVAFGLGYPLDDEFQRSSFKIELVRFKRGLKLSNFLGFFDLCRLLRHQTFDIIHIHGGNEAGILGRIAAKLTRQRYIIYSLHGTPTVDRSAWIIRAVIRTFDQVLDYCTDQYIAVSHFIGQRYLNNGIGLGRITTIHHGIPLEDSDISISNTQFRESLMLNQDVRLIGTVGLLEERKGIEYLLLAIPEVLQATNNGHFVIVGDGPLKHDLQALCEQLGINQSVTFLGWREDAQQLAQMFDILCHPALSEPLGLVLLEAMAYAKPVIASAVQGIPEVVVDGDTGLLTPARDSVALAKALTQLIANPELAKEMGKRGKQRVREQFSLTKMVTQYENLYLHASGRIRSEADR